MLKSLINQQNNFQARLDEQTYLLYAKEVNQLEAEWMDSLKYLECNFKFFGGIDYIKFPTPTNQKTFVNIIYDSSKGCEILKPGEPLPEGTKTMATSGTIPCVIKTLLEYSDQDINLVEIGDILASNGYLTPDKGTLWSAFDRIMEPIFGIKTQIQNSIFELCLSITQKKPVVALIPATYIREHIYCEPSEVHSNEAIIIWRLAGDNALITTTSSPGTHEINLYDLFRIIKRAWSCKQL